MAFALSACPNTQMVNVSKYPWNEYDHHMLEYAQKRCLELYPEAPCVKLFRKFNKQDYTVLCGS